MPPAHVRRASVSDLEQLAPLFDAYRVFYAAPPDLEGARRFLAERLARSESVIFLAKDNADEPALGFTQLYPSFSSVSMKSLWILNDLYVAPGARGRGVGELLLETARAYALETGAKGLSLATQHGNTTAQRLYDRAGYTRDNEFHHYTRYF